MGYKIKDPDAPATGRQTWAVYVASGVDVRECGLTKGKVGELLDKSGAGEDIRPLALALEGAVDKRRPTVSQEAVGTPSVESMPVADPMPLVPGVTRAQLSKRGGQHRRVVKPQIHTRGKAKSMRISIPADVARLIDPEQAYEPFVTPDGLLFRPVRVAD
jgi:hypothetical protein